MIAKTLIRTLVVLFYISCSAPGTSTHTLKIPHNRFYSVLPNAGTKGILISCARCGCFNETMKHFIQSKSQKYSGLFIGGDTTCGRFNNTNLILQSQLDKISDDFYNVVLFRKSGENVLCRIVETKENGRFEEICVSFFN
jgi:hypothetical protein